MTSFADRIRQAAQQKKTVATPAPMQKAGSITSQIQAQQTGKAAAPTTTGQSNIASQIAASQPSNLGQELQAQAEQMGAAEQQEQIKQSAIEQQRATEEAQTQQRATQGALDLLAGLESSTKRLDQREDALQLEQAASALRLQDKAYMAKLDQIARERNITNSIQFNEAMKNEMIGQQLENTLEDIGFSEDMANRKRQMDFETMIEDIKNANAILEAQVQDQARGQIIGAGAAAAKAGVEYGADNGWFDSTESTNVEGYGAPEGSTTRAGGPR